MTNTEMTAIVIGRAKEIQSIPAIQRQIAQRKNIGQTIEEIQSWLIKQAIATLTVPVSER